jgi:mono/diheme cytochrome c family protein
MRKLAIFLLLVLVISLAACGGGSDSGQGGATGGADAAAGEKLFNEKLIGTQPGCITCHSLEAGVTMVGPSLAGIGSRQDEAYIKQSINEPDAAVSEGFTAGVMPAALARELSEQQVEDLTAYLMTLK